MNQAIRNAWVMIIVMFLVLLGAASYIQVIGAQELKAHDFNTREIYKQFGSPRGPILVGGEPIAESVPSQSESFDYQRVYNEPQLYSALTGFYSLAYGSTGLESRMNAELTGTADGMFVDRIRGILSDSPMEGGQVELTIDPQMQKLAYSVLPENGKASVVITDPKTGDILAMASRPSYDTNLLASHSGTEAKKAMDNLLADGVSPYLNRPTQELAAPGSTFKLIDTIAMLESGDYAPEDSIANPTSLDLPQANTPISNFSQGICGQRTTAELSWIFAQSCNTPFAQAAMDLGQDKIRETAERFGFNESFDMPLSVTASNFPTEEIPQATLAQSVLGQVDVKATALQMNMVAAGIANDGVVMKPQLIDAVRGPDLNLISSPEPEVFSKATSPEVAEQMTGMMKRVMQEGTGSPARSHQVDIAAKTGTADIGTSGKVNSWITGFAPADDPQVAVTLVYEDVDYNTGSVWTKQNMKKIMEAVVE